MSKPFDASLKDLIASYPADWLALLGLPAGAGVEVIDADISTVTAAADRVLRVRGPEPWLLHLELQSSPKSELAEQLHWYNALLKHRHGQPVGTAVVLLRRQADSPQLNGVYREQLPGEQPHLEFRYRVVRLWQVPAGTVLAGGLGTLPLAPLADVTEDALPSVLRAMDERMARQATPEQAEVLWAAAFVLSGLRLSTATAAQLFQGVRFMSILEDSSVYQMILQRGATKALKETLLVLGQQRLGSPDAATVTALEAISDLEQLKRMRGRLLDVTTWAELLATP